MTPEVKQRIEQIRRGEVPEGYKKTAMGIVPSNWIETTLGEIYTERNEPGNDTLPLLMVSIHSGVSDGEVAEEDLPKKVKRIEDKSQYKHAMPGDLVFNMMRAWQGAIGSVRTEGMVSPAYIVAKPNELVDPVFMDYYMKTPRMINMIRRQSYGVTDFRLRLYWDSFSPIPCVLPPIEEQKRIAEILSVQDTLISLQRKEVAAYQQLKKSFLAKLLPKGGSNEPELRFKGFTDAWEQRKLGEICQVTMGQSPDGSTYSGIPSDYILVQGNADLKDGWVFPRVWTTQKTKAAEAGDLIMSVRAPAGAMGKTSYDVVLGRGVAGIKGNEFIYQSLVKMDSNGYWKKLASGSTFESISSDVVNSAELVVPQDEAEQVRIGDYFASLDRLITLHQCKEALQQNKENALMQLLLTGQLQVNV